MLGVGISSLVNSSALCFPLSATNPQKKEMKEFECKKSKSG